MAETGEGMNPMPEKTSTERLHEISRKFSPADVITLKDVTEKGLTSTDVQDEAARSAMEAQRRTLVANYEQHYGITPEAQDVQARAVEVMQRLARDIQSRGGELPWQTEEREVLSAVVKVDEQGKLTIDETALDTYKQQLAKEEGYRKRSLR